MVKIWTAIAVQNLLTLYFLFGRMPAKLKVIRIRRALRAYVAKEAAQ